MTDKKPIGRPKKGATNRKRYNLMLDAADLLTLQRIAGGNISEAIHLLCERARKDDKFNAI